jgi:hypothetical protein
MPAQEVEPRVGPVSGLVLAQVLKARIRIGELRGSRLAADRVRGTDADGAVSRRRVAGIFFTIY